AWQHRVGRPAARSVPREFREAVALPRSLRDRDPHTLSRCRGPRGNPDHQLRAEARSVALKRLSLQWGGLSNTARPTSFLEHWNCWNFEPLTQPIPELLCEFFVIPLPSALAFRSTSRWSAAAIISSPVAGQLETPLCPVLSGNVPSR